MISARCPFTGALADETPVVHADHPDRERHPGTNLAVEKSLDLVNEHLQSTFDRPHLDDVQNITLRKNTINHMTLPSQHRLLTLHHGGTTISLPVTTRSPTIRHQIPREVEVTGQVEGLLKVSFTVTSIRLDRLPTTQCPRQHFIRDLPSKPITAYSSTDPPSRRHQRQPTPAASGDDHSITSVNIPSGHMPHQWSTQVSKTNGYDGSNSASNTKTECQRLQKFHQISSLVPLYRWMSRRSMYQSRHCTTWMGRIPSDIAKKAVNLLFSTNLLPGYELNNAYVLELPSTNVHTLILPLPSSSLYQMPKFFPVKTQSHLGTDPRHEGKIRPANWQFNRNHQKCDVPSFGAFFLSREISNTDTDIPPWAIKETHGLQSKEGH